MQTEKNLWLRGLSMILTLALLISCVPNQVYAMAGEALADLLEATDTAVLQPNATPDSMLSTAHIVAEDVSKRGESYKEYIMNNGLRYATVYPSAIHYEADGQWKDIDNTLVSAVSGGKAVYQNAAGAWSVKFPQRLSGSDMISITRDSHTVQFGMVGEMRSTGGLVVASVGEAGRGETAGTLAVSNAQAATAQIQQIDLTELRAAAEHPETILDKLNSRLAYTNVYPNTNVVYDLQGNQLKESVVLQRYDASLWGYRYTLNTGDLIPVLRADQQIDLCHPETNEVIFTMPAPYMQDHNGETSGDVEVVLTPNGGNYLLSYYLPREWLADTSRTWPVILDPVVTLYGNYSNVQDVRISENIVESYSDLTLECGHTNISGVMRSYVKFITLPQLPDSAVIVDAEISLYRPINGTQDSVIEVHKVTSPWKSQTLTWNDRDNYDRVIADYVVCRLANRYRWNITSIVSDWYANENNNGVMFKASDEIEDARNENWKQFYSSDMSNSVQNGPQLTITYQNHNGLEDYWSYSSASAGRAGTGYVNLFTGNLTWVRGDLGFDGNRMPVSISHVYNSNDSQRNDFGMGYGWRTNYNQTITASGDGAYVWEDGDGTRHEFVTTNSVISDVDGLHLTLTVTATGYLLTDVYGNVSEFTGNKLTKMTTTRSANAGKGVQTTTIEYNATTGFISLITDGAGRKYEFSYNDAGLLDKIAYKGTGSTELTYVTYTYSNDNLTKVTDVDGCCTAYEYTGHFLTIAHDVSVNIADNGNLMMDVEYYATYSYKEATDSNSVTPVIEAKEYKSMGLDDSLSGHYTFDYSAHYTKVTDIDDKDTNYQFNDFGNLVAVYNSDGHVQYTKYAINDVSELNNPDNSISLTAELHQVLEISDIDGTSNNLMPNGSFEDGEPTSTASGWDENGTISNEYAYRGNQSLRVASHGLYDNVATYGPTYTIEPGETYTFSAYVFTATPDQRVQLWISLRPLSGTNYTKIYMDEPGWRRVQVSYTNEGTAAETIYTRIEVESGTVYVDGIQVEKTGTASPYNEVANGDFLSNGHTSGSWVDKDGNSSAGYHFNDNSAPNLMLSSGAVKIEGDPTAEKYLEQYIPISGGAGDVFVFAGWAKADALPLTDSRQFGLKVIFNNRDGSKTEYYTSFDPDIGSENWQYAALTAMSDKLYVYITIQLVYNAQANTALFDGIQLTEGRAGNTYTYDVNKNVVEETNILGQITEYEYHDNGVDLKKIIPSVGSIVHYEEYDDYHNVIKMNETISDESGTDHTITYEYTYDDYGNVTSVTVTQGTLKMKSTTAYTSDGNYIKATTDGTGKTTRYGYHLQTGVLKWVQYPEDTPGTADTEDAEGTEGTESTEYVAGTPDTRTYYVYDEMFRLIETYVTTDKNDTMYAQYEYENELLKELWTQSTVYRFTYNYYNLRTSVSVGDLELARYSYNSKHYLTQLDFANNDSVKYSYDSLGRVTREDYYEDRNTTTPSRTIRYYYDNGGALARMKDSATGMETVCVYDYAGRVGAYVEVQGNTYREIVYSYDANGNISKVSETVKEYRGYGTNVVADKSVYNYEYFYDYKNRLETVTTHDGQKDYHYDGLDRLTEETVKTSDGTEILSYNYNYKSATVGGTYVTTNQVYSKIVTADYYQKNFIYGYDDNGNIVSVGDGSRTITYEYDSANQLIRENNPYENRTWVWTYDAAGNITLKEEYTYTTVATDDLVNPIDSFAYTYSNADWGDLLTAYDGLVIQYDEIGNPLSDGKWTYTWKQGRQLATMSDGETTWTYTYDANGMRLSRSTGNVTYTYVYTDGLLTRMTKGDIMLYFTYDAAGTPLTVSIHTGTNCKVKKGQACGGDCKVYYYVTNLQGDVIAILDETGNEVAEYSYDAWGRLLCDLDEDEETIYSLNPLLYRGYVYDHETGLYYLQSRYYNPEIGRFISADALLSTGQGVLGNNMFAYCNNNPVNCEDPSGNLAITSLLIAIGIGFGVGFVTGGAFEVGKQVYNNGWNPDDWDGRQIALSALGGGVAGAISAIPIPGSGFLSYLGTFAIGGGASVVGGLISGSVDSFGSAAIAFGLGGIANVAGRGLSELMKNFNVSKQISSKAREISNMNSMDRTLSVARMLGPEKFMKNVHKVWDYTQIRTILMDGPAHQLAMSAADSLTRYMVYSSITSSLLSGWY